MDLKLSNFLGFESFARVKDLAKSYFAGVKK